MMPPGPSGWRCVPRWFLVSRRLRVGNGQSELTEVLSNLRQRSSFAAITIGSGEDRKYLLQWNSNWGMFNLVGGKVDNQKATATPLPAPSSASCKKSWASATPKITASCMNLSQ